MRYQQGELQTWRRCVRAFTKGYVQVKKLEVAVYEQACFNALNAHRKMNESQSVEKSSGVGLQPIVNPCSC